MRQRTLLSSWNDVIDYCRTGMAFADREQFRILFLDKRNQLISEEVQQTGTVDHTPVLTTFVAMVRSATIDGRRSCGHFANPGSAARE